MKLTRRDFAQLLAMSGLNLVSSGARASDQASGSKRIYNPRRIENVYALLSEPEAKLLAEKVGVAHVSSQSLTLLLSGNSQVLQIGESFRGWLLLAILDDQTAVLEYRVRHRGILVYLNESGGEVLRLDEYLGTIREIKPRQINAEPGIALDREGQFHVGPDRASQYVLGSSEDPCFENVAALGSEYIGWTFVGRDGGGPKASIYLDEAGNSRQRKDDPAWAPDRNGPLLDMADHLPFSFPEGYSYTPGYSKRTLLGGHLPVAHIGVWNPKFKRGYEMMALQPEQDGAPPIARIRVLLDASEKEPLGSVVSAPDEEGMRFSEEFVGGTRKEFFTALRSTATYWEKYFEAGVRIDIPDQWLLQAAKAGLVISRCSYHGLEPTYQVGEGAYTVVPERSHALFPVASYEFVWAHQLWGQISSADKFLAHYLTKYILPNGDFTYNSQDQVEGPLNVGFFLSNSARAFRYGRDVKALEERLPTLRRMTEFVAERISYSRRIFDIGDRRYGLIWGSPEADLTSPNHDTPDANPYYFQNAACVWRGLQDHADALSEAAKAQPSGTLAQEAEYYAGLASRLRQDLVRSLAATLQVSSNRVRDAGITPFHPNDTDRDPTELKSYENHRFMQDWFLSDFGVPAFDQGHLHHRELAGQQLCGLHTDGDAPRTSNFMEHGTLAVRIRQEDYRPFLLTLYALVCFAADSGNRYAPEDAYIPGGHPEQQSRYGWSAVVNSTLQPTMGLRWLLCYEDSNSPVCHLQKAAPKHWFEVGLKIGVKNCPTRFGEVTWQTEALSNGRWRVSGFVAPKFSAQLVVHIHKPNGQDCRSTTSGKILGNAVQLSVEELQLKPSFDFIVS